ncbi:MAG: 16S rRNA (cytosine(1402)-N(4))-methyltransferase RsmH [Rhodospirillaceae bacterium]|nr:16S rRNA (cytosine(1402)-N(4))-methyltransferase RsmH [Rhodospirillaceae bacterium]
MHADFTHHPVLLEEVVEGLNLHDGGVYVDTTFGNGGYSAAFLSRVNCKVVGIDRDPQVISRAQELSQQYPGRFEFVQGLFSQMDQLLLACNIRKVDGIALDLGVSSRQLDDPKRGFSFRLDGPLDMRMSMNGISAADIINNWSEKQLSDLFFELGEEPSARRIARAIVYSRSNNPILRTIQLAKIAQEVSNTVATKKIDPATRTFQALRIATNNELAELEMGLEAAERLLKEGGRLAVVSFHSLEDRRVKNFLRSRSAPPSNQSRYLPVTNEVASPSTFRLVRRDAVTPSLEEMNFNRRARSAKLRLAERTNVASITEE